MVAMYLESQFDVMMPREIVVNAVSQEETLLNLFPDTRVEIIKSEGNKRTLLTHYTALGQEGTATFHFTFEDDGGISFSKVCDGRIWKKLTGTVTFTTLGIVTRVHIKYVGTTKALVPEFTIHGPMQDQIDQTAHALRKIIENAA